MSGSGTAIPGLGCLAKGCPGQALLCPGGPSSGTKFAGRAVKREVVVCLLGNWPSRTQGFRSRAEWRPAVPSLWSLVLGDACANRTGFRVQPQAALGWPSQDQGVRKWAVWVRPCREARGCHPLARGLAVLKTGGSVPCGAAAGLPELPVASNQRRGIQPSRAPGLRPWATCVLATLGSGSNLLWLWDSDPRMRVSGH